MPNLSEREKKWLTYKLIEIFNFCKENNISYISISSFPNEITYPIIATYRIGDDQFDYEYVTVCKENIEKITKQMKRGENNNDTKI